MPLDDLTAPYKEGIKLYNSQSTSKEMLKDNFVIRLKEYQKLWGVIKNSTMTHPEQHYIVQGVRGSGKTTLLSRLALAVEEDQALSKWLIPIVFKEEEFGVSSLFTFWERVAEELNDVKECAEFTGLASAIDELEANDPKPAINIINSRLEQAGKKVILFIDNLVELFDNFSANDEEILREVLITNSNIRLIGGSAISLEAFYDQKAPFYQFFNVINLKGLKKAETIKLLQKLGEHEGPTEQSKIEALLQQQPERIESIRRLTGGIPRTMVILFNILLDGPKGNTYALLEDTIDKTTPLYKHRMEDLSKQQKPIVNAIALNWDAISAKEIAELTRLDSKQVSAQLSQLEKNWIIEKIPTSTKNHLYAIKERFFNIWYLMRYGRRRDKNKVLWLTRFFEIWCSPEELTQRSHTFISQLDQNSHPKAALTYANALLCSGYISLLEKARLFQHMTDFLQQLGDKSLARDLLPVELSDELSDDERQMFGFLQTWWKEKSVQQIRIDFIKMLASGKKQPLDIDDFCQKYSMILLKECVTSFNSYLDSTETQHALLIRLELVRLLLDVHNTDAALLQLQKSEALACQLKLSTELPLEILLEIQILLVETYLRREEYDNAEQQLKQAAKLGFTDVDVVFSSIYLGKGQSELAEKYARAAISANQNHGHHLLGVSLMMQNKTEEALVAFNTSLECEDKIETHSNMALCNLELKNPQAAITHLLEALKIDDQDTACLQLLGQIYIIEGELEQATALYQKLIALGEADGDPTIYNQVAWTLFENHTLKQQALDYSTKALQLTPDFVELHTHTCTLLWNNQFKLATEQMNQLLNDHLDKIDDYEADFIELFLLFLAKGQTHLVDKWLKNHQLTERLKPLYYALMALMREQYPNEILRMGAELTETVDEILAKIKQMAIDYK